MCVEKDTSYEKSNDSYNSQYITNDVHSFLFYSCVILFGTLGSLYIFLLIQDA